MSFLLDTHVWLWAAFESHRLPHALMNELEQNACYVSIASIWEAQIKSDLGKLPLPIPLLELVEQTEQAFAILPISPRHILTVGHLPKHHRDPFDRMLIAQATTEDLKLVTVDDGFDGMTCSCFGRSELPRPT